MQPAFNLVAFLRKVPAMRRQEILSRRGAVCTCLILGLVLALPVRGAVILNGGFELPPDLAFAPGHSPDQSQPIPGWLATGHSDGDSYAHANTMTNGTASEGQKYVNLNVHAFTIGGGDAQFFFDSSPFVAAAGDILSFDYRGTATLIQQPAVATSSVSIYNGNHTVLIAATPLADSANWRTLNYLLPAPDATGKFILEFFTHVDAALANPNDPFTGGAADVNLDIDNARVPEPATSLPLALGAIAVVYSVRRRGV
jgi:hypothetical protein